MTEDEMVGWHHWLNGREFEQTWGEMVKDKEAWQATVHGVTKSWTQLGLNNKEDVLSNVGAEMKQDCWHKC